MNLAETIRAAGIVGCGGAGFPTHVKYTGGQTETILVNGAECEPLLATDRYLMRHFAREIVSAAAALGRETGAKRCVIALKAAYTAERAALEAAIAEQAAPVALHLLESFFPAGDEQSLVFEVTGRVVPPGGIPLAVGCVVNNTATVLCIHHAMEGRPFTQKYLTVTGEVAAPCIVKAPVGTPVEACIALAGGTHLSDYAVVNGGPMMGRPMTREEAGHAYVTKTMSGLIVLPPDSPVVRRAQTRPEQMVNRARSACIQCSFCTQLCPRALLGHPLQPHRIMRRLAAGGLEALLDTPEGRSAALCCECGICEIYACPMGLQPRQVNAALKKELARNKIRYQGEETDCQARQERAFRKAPAARVAARTGVAAYAGISIDQLRRAAPKRVVLSLRQSAGAPAESVVRSGERVELGQRIAACPQGALGADLHASISGTVTVEAEWIAIDADKGGER